MRNLSLPDARIGGRALLQQIPSYTYDTPGKIMPETAKNAGCAQGPPPG